MRSLCFALTLVLCCGWLSLPAAVAQEGRVEVSGLSVGEKDTTRLQFRLTGKDEKTDNNRILDQRQGGEEKRVRRELREEGEKLLMAEEEARIDRARVRKQQEASEVRRRLTEREFEKKKKVEFSSILDD